MAGQAVRPKSSVGKIQELQPIRRVRLLVLLTDASSCLPDRVAHSVLIFTYSVRQQSRLSCWQPTFTADKQSQLL